MSPNLYFSEPEYLLFRLSDRRLIVPLTDDMREHGEFRDVWSRIPAGAVNVCVEYANLRVAFESNSLLSDRPRVLSNRRGVWAQFVDFGPERATHRNGREVISEFHLQDRLENVRVLSTACFVSALNLCIPALALCATVVPCHRVPVHLPPGRYLHTTTQWLFACLLSAAELVILLHTCLLQQVIRAGYVVGQLGQLHFVDRNGISDVLDLQVRLMQLWSLGMCHLPN